MNNLIDESFFWGELKIGGLMSSVTAGNNTIQSKASDAKVQEITSYITKYQKEYLTKAFGKRVANALPDDMKSLLVDYDTRVSPIANYVYYKYMRANMSQTTTAGEKSLTRQDSRAVSPIYKMISAWNEMVDMTAQIHSELDEDESPLEDFTYEEDVIPNIDVDDDVFHYINSIGA